MMVVTGPRVELPRRLLSNKSLRNGSEAAFTELYNSIR